MADQSSSQQNISDALKKNSDQVIPWAVLVALLGILVYVSWNELDYRGAKQFWDNPKYSHGWLVPIFTVILLWMRHESFGPVTLAARWAGVGLLSAGLAMRLVFTYFPNHFPEMVSFVPAVAGVFLLVGGWKMLRWAGPAVAFLIFMFPLPGFLDARLLAPLQKVATMASTYVLQTIGIPSYSEGNRIVIGEVQLGVVEACSGLRMLTIFVALAVAITLVTDRPMWERIVIVLSAVPIALAVNIVRITVTGILHLTAGPELADMVFHDLAGWFMMPMALGLLYVEFQILSHLLIEEGQAGPLQVA
ncbi:MAG: exosortase/archaeosortase family protein [Pirellulales bacterium]